MWSQERIKYEDQKFARRAAEEERLRFEQEKKEAEDADAELAKRLDRNFSRDQQRFMKRQSSSEVRPHSHPVTKSTSSQASHW